MKDWEVSARVIELGHTIATRRAGLTCQRCGRTFSDILKGKLPCSPTAS